MHIGKRIKEVMDEKGLSACWLANKLPCERSNVYNMFKRSSIGVDLLYAVSTILAHNFFAELSKEWEARCGAPKE